jgi:hypothetical protein
MNTAAILTLLTEPETFFERRGPEPGLMWPVLVVTTIALLSLIASIVTVL